MPDKPRAEIEVGEPLVRTLLARQASAIPDVTHLRLTLANEGWDNSVWRLGDAYAVRMPRRAVAAPLVRNEQLTLPAIADRLAAVDIRVPVPVVAGTPDAGYPWAWSVVPWFAGCAGLHIPRPDRRTWAGALGRAVVALHAPAAQGYPENPVRGRALAERAPAVTGRLSSLRATPGDLTSGLDVLERLWRRALDAARWTQPPVWIHGDLHPGNLVGTTQGLEAIIDFGDVTAGDPAYDLAVAWLAFDARGRELFVAATDGRYDAATWTRAHGWAAAVTTMLLDASDDNPDYLALGRECLAELVASVSSRPAPADS